MIPADRLFKTMMDSDEPFSERCPVDGLQKLVRRRKFREFVDTFRAIMSVVRLQKKDMYQAGEQQYFDDLFGLWFKTLEQPSFNLGPGDEKFFILNANITNLVAVTSHRNGDDCLKKVVGQPDNMTKLLLLYTPRSQLRIPIKPLFDAHPMLASLWYSSVWNWADSYVHPLVLDNYQYFLDNVDDRFEPFDSNLILGYFRCTYVDNLNDRVLKRVYSKAIARYASAARIHNVPNPKSIAVASAYWNGEHAVYRAFAPYVGELAKHYDLTLINFAASDGRPPKTDGFKRVLTIHASPDRIDVESILHNDFQLVYFPDVGLSQESMYLANMRIAPIQCMGTGHPISSTALNMDYFISGGEVETPDQPERNYDERLVLLPGLSAHPVRPNYTAQNLPPADVFTINAPWVHMKNNARMAAVFRRILDAARRPVRFAIFPGCAMTGNSSYMVTVQDYANFLPQDAYTVYGYLKYDQYMALQERGRFTMHSHPFGGGTTAVDSFIAGRPLTVFRGRHEYNRYAAALLIRLGLGDLVADTEDEWVEVCARLINDDLYLEDASRRLREADLDQVLFRPSDADNLRRAFDRLIEHDAALRRDGSRKPVAIE